MPMTEAQRRARQKYRASPKGRATTAKYVRQNRSLYQEAAKRYWKRHPLKAVANAAVSNAVRSGRLTPQPCEVCGATPTEAHHHDYRKPLEVSWLCKLHHEEVHHGV